LLIAVPNADDPPSGNHESLQSKIPKRKKLRPHSRLSCKIEYFIQTTSADLSGQSAFFTDDELACGGGQTIKPGAIRQGFAQISGADGHDYAPYEQAAIQYGSDANRCWRA
jgi:hypothetical protein